MLKKDIKEGETYLFFATDNPARKHLEGKPFTVQEIKKVFRKVGKAWTRKHWRFFNDEGIGARASELEPLDDGYRFEISAEIKQGVPFVTKTEVTKTKTARNDAGTHEMVINWSKRGGKTKAGKDWKNDKERLF